MLKINLKTGVTLDAHEIECDAYAYKLLDRNGDVLNRVGSSLVESIEPMV